MPADQATGHAPTPWTARADRRELDTPMVMEVLDANEDAVASGFGLDDANRANAALIVRAVNSHAALVEALKRARRYVDHAYEPAFPDRDENDSILSAIDAALKLALGEA